MNPKNEQVYRKVIGVMSSSSVYPLRIFPAGGKVRIFHEDKLLLETSQEEFMKLEPVEILAKAGVAVRE